MKPIYIPQLLKTPQRTKEIEFEEILPSLATLTPVRGKIVITHGGTFLEVSIDAETIITLTCDRCLKNYNHRLVVKTSELIWLEDPNSQPLELIPEKELKLDEMDENLDPNGYFEMEDWLYQQVCLALPMRQLCDENCQAPIPNNNNNNEPLIDQRWASLANLIKE